MINIWDFNARVLISFSLVMIVMLLTYIAFYKDSGSSKRKAKG